MIITLLVLGISVVLFVSGKMRPDLVAICALLCLMLFNILTPEEGSPELSGLLHPLSLFLHLSLLPIRLVATPLDSLGQF